MKYKWLFGAFGLSIVGWAIRNLFFRKLVPYSDFITKVKG
jgi:hypothetical protein